MATSTSAAPGVGGHRGRISQLVQRIASDGAHVQQLVERYDRAQATATVVAGRLRVTRAQLTADRHREAMAATQLRTVAVQAYVTGGGLSSPALLTTSASTQGMASVYVDAAGARLRGAISSFQWTAHVTRATRSALLHDEAKATATMAALLPARQAATRAVLADERLLSGVRGNLQALLAQAAARRRAAELAAERRMAARAAAAVAASERPARVATARRAAARSAATLADPTTTTSGGSTSGTPTSTSTSTTTTSTTTTTTLPPAPPPPAATAPAATASPAPGGYADPLRSVGGLSPERVDQGVDYGGYGPIYAIGDGVVLSTVNGGWPGGTFIAYRLTDGPAAGLVVYAAEDIEPTVQVGQAVTAGTQIGVVYAGPDGIETGWAAPGGLGNTMASASGQFFGGNSTAFGANFSQLLSSLGAPGGILQNAPATGSLPAGWPAF